MCVPVKVVDKNLGKYESVRYFAVPLQLLSYTVVMYITRISLCSYLVFAVVNFATYPQNLLTTDVAVANQFQTEALGLALWP